MTKLLSGLVAAAFTLALVAPATAAVVPRVAADSQVTLVQQTEKKVPAKKQASKKPAKKQTAKKPAKKAPAKAA
jgi:multisubunit Na+/H+ antiporter MnhG subunit